MGMGENDTICPRCNIFDISLECSGSLISTDIIENTNGGIVVSDSQFMTGSGEISFCNSCFITFSDSSMRYDGYTYGSFSCILTCWHSIVCEKLIIKYILDAYLQINFIINNLPSKNPLNLRGFFYSCVSGRPMMMRSIWLRLMPVIVRNSCTKNTSDSVFGIFIRASIFVLSYFHCVFRCLFFQSSSCRIVLVSTDRSIFGLSLRSFFSSARDSRIVMISSRNRLCVSSGSTLDQRACATRFATRARTR